MLSEHPGLCVYRASILLTKLHKPRTHLFSPLKWPHCASQAEFDLTVFQLNSLSSAMSSTSAGWHQLKFQPLLSLLSPATSEELRGDPRGSARVRWDDDCTTPS